MVEGITLPPVDARCLIYGLTLCFGETQAAPEMGLYANFAGRFVLRRYIPLAIQIRHGPWAQVVRRREIEQRRRLFQLRSLEYLYGWGWHPSLERQWEIARLEGKWWL